MPSIVNCVIARTVLIEDVLIKDPLYFVTRFAFNLRNNFIFTHPLDNLCENALDLTNGNLIVDNNWPGGTYCQWLISALDDDHYVNLEFENIDVRFAELKYISLLIL